MKKLLLVIYFLKRQSPGCLFLLLISCYNTGKPKEEKTVDPAYMQNSFIKINAAKSLLQNGDMIFRNGIDEVSQAARSMNRKDTSYSHCGLVMIEYDTVFVYHALGGIYNPDQKLLREPVDSFCNPKDNNAFGVYRFPLDQQQLSILKDTVYSWYGQGLKFDMFFNFLSDDKLYCSEFVFKSLNHSMNRKMDGYVRLDTLPFGVTTDDLYLHPDSKLIIREKFFSP